jgi:two-component system, NarL family, response regulator DesR
MTIARGWPGAGLRPRIAARAGQERAGQRPRTAARGPASLHLSAGTVRNHLSAAIQKLGARNRAEAVQIAGRKGWL